MLVEKKNLARHFRKNMSKPEVLLWVRLSKDKLGFQFRRQDPFYQYILDFYCPEFKVAIEVDGKDHQFRQRQDSMRDQFLADHGIHILRFPASSVLKNPDGVAENIQEYLTGLKRTTE